MKGSLTDDILHVCKLLNRNAVQYLIVGGTAVAFYGYFRWSIQPTGTKAEKFDLDIWYNPTYKNYFNLLNALAELGQDVTEFIEEKSPNPLRSFFRFETEKLTLDFLPKLKGLSKFSQSFKTKQDVDLKGVVLPIIGIDELLEEKATNARLKDREDIKRLKSNRRP